MSQDLCRCGSISLLVYVLVILFGVSSWVDINGLWVELPILVQYLPEGWDLPSYMAVIIQIANVAPLVYTVASTLWPHRLLEIPVIYIIISLGGVSCLLLAFLWNQTSEIAGTEHSTGLFALQFCLALVDCTSSVAFLPFMSIFKPQYMTAYFIGEGLSGLIPSLIALGQGAGNMECVKVPHFHNQSSDTFSNASDALYNVPGAYNVTSYASNITTESPSFSVFPMYQDPKFGVRTFFLLLMVLMILSGVSFTLLNFWSYCKKEQVQFHPKVSDEWQASSLTSVVTPDACDDVNNLDKEIIISSDYTKCNDQKPICKQNRRHQDDSIKKHAPLRQNSGSSSNSHESFSKKISKGMSKSKYTLFLVLTAWLNALSNGVLPSIQSYSCLPYGIQPYHLSVTLASIANPVACFASFFLTMHSALPTMVMTTVSTGLAAYVITTAATSPSPPLVDQSAGVFVIILAWVLVTFCLTYTKVSIATEFRKEGKKALLWVGASTQAGSLLGALVTFFLVNYHKLFQVANPCI